VTASDEIAREWSVVECAPRSLFAHAPADMWKANKSRDAFVPESSKVIRMSEKSVAGIEIFQQFSAYLFNLT
jgi:hypothetical protein